MTLKFPPTRALSGNLTRADKPYITVSGVRELIWHCIGTDYKGNTMKSKIDRAMKSTIPLWLAIAILAIVNIVLIVEVFNPYRSITADELRVNEIMVVDNDGMLKIRISGELDGFIGVGWDQKKGVTIRGGKSPMVSVGGGRTDFTLISSDGVQTEPGK